MALSDTPVWPYHYEAAVKGSEEMAWSVLIDKIKNPLKYMPAKSPQILGEGSEWVERKLTMGGGLNHQHITVDEKNKLVSYKYVTHEQLDGYIYNSVTVEDGQVYIHVWGDLKGKRGLPEDLVKKAINAYDFKRACLANKGVIEKYTAAGHKNAYAVPAW